MLKLLPIFLICCMLGIFSEYRTAHDNKLVSTGRKDLTIYMIIIIYMVIYAGLRTRYNDTGAYRMGYNSLDLSHGLFTGLQWSPNESDGFQVAQRLLRAAGFSFNSALMVFGAIDIGVTMWFLRKYSDDIGLTVFLVFTTGIFTFNLAALMQCTATAFGILAVDRAIEKKWVQYVIFLLLAMSFHTYAFVFLVAPLATFKPWSKKTYLMLGMFLLIGIFLPQLLGIVVTVTEAMGEGYDVESFSGAGVNVFRFLVVSVPTVLSFILQKKLEGRTTRADNIIINLGMLNSEIMFVALFGTANYFARLANYFIVFQLLTLIRMLRYFDENMRKLMTGLCVFFYLIYFFYAHAINQPYDLIFESMSLIDYLKSIM